MRGSSTSQPREEKWSSKPRLQSWMTKNKEYIEDDIKYVLETKREGILIVPIWLICMGDPSTMWIVVYEWL